MIDSQSSLREQVVSFGAFRLHAARRTLERSGVALDLGSRALELLIVLIERAGEVVSKNELMSRVWPDVTVDDVSLRVHIAALRKALADGEPDARYVATLTGRGYCFVAPVVRSNEAGSAVTASVGFDPSSSLPARLTRMVGRGRTVGEISEQLRTARFVTIVGPGGIGKSTVAVSVGHELLAEFAGAVYFFDLGPINDPLLIPTAVASRFGLLIQSSDPTPGIVAALREQRMLLIFDSCEHVIEIVAALAERIFEGAPQVHILATSREPLRVEGEHVHQLAALGSPPADANLTAAQALDFPAVQLFVERVNASGRRFELNDADAPIVGELCRKLDGIALAIELAAGRANAYSVQETVAQLNDRFRLLWEGRRTALPRHQTMHATIEWSYDLLSADERMALCRLSVFAGTFTLEAARAVATGADLDENVSLLGNLVAKSLVSASLGDTSLGDSTRYRLLDTTRAYASGKLLECGESQAVRRRHAAYYLELLNRTNAGLAKGSGIGAMAAHGEHLGNVRGALEWSLSERGDISLGIALAAASAPLLVEMSLLTECQRWTEQAVAMLDSASYGSRSELELQAALGLSMMFTRGNTDQVRCSLLRALELAEQLDDPHNQLRLLGRLHIFHERIGDFRSALTFAERSEAVAASIGDPVGIAESHSALGISRHLEGNTLSAHAHLEAALVQLPASQRIDAFHFGFDYRNRARIALARTLWLEGYPDCAAMVARQTVEEAETFNHPVTLCIALIWAVSVSIWEGNLTVAEEYIDRFIAEADRHYLEPYQAVGRGVKGELAVKRGQAETGIVLLRDALEMLHGLRYELLTTTFNTALAEGLAIAGSSEDALATIGQAIALVEQNGDLFMMPELLRIKAAILMTSPDPDFALAERCLLQSLGLAERQSALSWQLRTATSLAQLYLMQNQSDQAKNVLAPLVRRFTEGFETSDLQAAKNLLQGAGRLPRP
jgi:predicted ATPase/DNA-binding winged helix-turn-helix (wHTH) protein